MKRHSVFSCAMLFAALSTPLFTGCRDCPVEPDPCRSEVLMGGVDDHFAAGDLEYASPSPEMMSYMLGNYYNPFLQHQFCQTQIDRPVGHTFQLAGVDAAHPAEVTKGIFSMRVKALGSALHNDFFHLIVDDGHGGIIGGYSASLAFLNGGSWEPGDEMLITLDLGNLPLGQNAPQDQTNLLDDMSTGRLHMYVQDDTAVDFVKLEVEYCGARDDDPSRDDV